jgi:hypothetical protein
MHEAHTHPHGTVSRAHVRTYLVLQLGDAIYCCLASIAALTGPSLQAFFATWIRHFRHFYLEGETHKLPAGRG